MSKVSSKQLDKTSAFADGGNDGRQLSLAKNAIRESNFAFQITTVEIPADDFVLQSGNSEFTLATTALLDENLISGSMLFRNGVALDARVDTLTAEGQWKLTADKVTVYGDITGELSDVYTLKYFTATGTPVTGASVPLEQVYCYVRRTTTQSIPNNTTTIVQFDSTISETHEMHNPVTNNSRIVAPSDGYYLVSFTGHFVATTAQVIFSLLHSSSGQKTAIGDFPSSEFGGTSKVKTGSSLLYFSKGQYIEMRAYQNSGASLNLSNTWTQLTMIKVA